MYGVQLANAIRVGGMAWRNNQKQTHACHCRMERTPEQSLGVETGTTSHGEQAKRSTYNVVGRSCRFSVKLLGRYHNPALLLVKRLTSPEGAATLLQSRAPRSRTVLLELAAVEISAL